MYTRKYGVENACWATSEAAGSRDAATTAVGWRSWTSFAKLGPERAATEHDGSTSWSTLVIVSLLPGSSPFETLTTTGECPPRASATVAPIVRTAWEGVADTTSSASATTVPMSPEARRSRWSRQSGRNREFTARSFTSSTTSGSRAQRRTWCPLPVRRSARVVPQLPAPTTPILTVSAPPRPSGTVSARCRPRGAGCWTGA